jgi:flagellar hook-associated protein 1
MNSTFMGLEIGKRGLMSHQQALHVTGHNISNAENKEYSRQRVVITTADPLYLPSLNRAKTEGDLGQGSTVASVERIRNSFIDDRIISEKNTQGYWDMRNQFILEVEKVYNEPGEESIRAKMDLFWKSWENLNQYPEDRSARESVQKRGVSLTTTIQHTFRQLDELQKNANMQIKARVNEVNNYAREIRDLNERILKSQALGNNPNDLLDRRDALVEKLSKIVHVSVGRTDKDELIVYIGSENLVQGEVIHKIKAEQDPKNNGMYKVVWEKSKKNVLIKGGNLAGLIEARDVVIRNNINDLNALTINFSDLINEVHRDGFGRNGETNHNFFQHLNISRNPEGNFDLNNDGVDDVTAIYKVAGNNKVDSDAAIGISGTITFQTSDELHTEVKIDYRPDDTIDGIIKRINNERSGIVAYINHEGKLALKATLSKDDQKKHFMLRHVEDSGQLLVGLTGILKESGPAGSFDYRRVNDVRKFLPTGESITLTPKFNPASNMALDRSILNDVDKIAAAKGKDIGGTGDYNTTNGIGDGSNALEIARIKHKNSMIDKSTTFNDFYNSLIARIGTQGEEAKEMVKNQKTILNNLSNLRESVSGINLDEEMANMVAFQHGYNAAARVISTMDKMLEVIINRMGV